MTTDPPLWYDERTSSWRPVADLPAPKPDTYDVVVTGLTRPKDTIRIARIVADTTGDSVDEVLAKLAGLPATVVEGEGYATAQGVGGAISEKGAEWEIYSHTTVVPSPPPAALV